LAAPSGGLFFQPALFLTGYILENVRIRKSTWTANPALRE